MTSHIDRLRRLSMSDRRTVDDVLAAADDGIPETLALDARARALVRVAALVALDGPSAAFDETIATALAAGASPDDIVDTMIAIGPIVGSAHLVSSAPKLAMALGYDVGAELEGLDAP